MDSFFQSPYYNQDQTITAKPNRRAEGTVVAGSNLAQFHLHINVCGPLFCPLDRITMPRPVACKRKTIAFQFWCLGIRLMWLQTPQTRSILDKVLMTPAVSYPMGYLASFRIQVHPGSERQQEGEIKMMLRYTINPKPILASWDPVSWKTNNKKKKNPKSEKDTQWRSMWNSMVQYVVRLVRPTHM